MSGSPFAVAAHLDPEILVVDEVLAVGDASFRKNAWAKWVMSQRKDGLYLFVSHNMGAIPSSASGASCWIMAISSRWESQTR